MGLDMYCCKLLIAESNTPDWQNICSVPYYSKKIADMGHLLLVKCPKMGEKPVFE